MRIAKWLIVVSALVLIIVYYTGSFLARQLFIYGVDYVRPELADYGITLHKFNYQNINLYSPRSFLVRNVDIEFDLAREIYGKKSFNAEFFAKNAKIQIIKWRDPAIQLTLNDFTLYVQSDEERQNRPFGKFENAYWKGETPIQLYDFDESGKIILEKISTLFDKNSIPDIMEFRGTALLSMDGKEIRVRVYTVRNQDRTFLRLNEEDILKASEDFEDVDISQKEAEILSLYPARVLHILKISRDAKRISELEKRKNPGFPEDAYKHIYWSYHLTKTFGPEFAKMITDAHETLPNNTQKQRIMDFHNNKIGRELAETDLDHEDLRRTVLNSPEVIRFPDQIN